MELQVSEDVELGSRIHFAGFKSVFLAENLATGEVILLCRYLILYLSLQSYCRACQIVLFDTSFCDVRSAILTNKICRCRFRLTPDQCGASASGGRRVAICMF